jgi:hypothetical protein
VRAFVSAHVDQLCGLFDPAKRRFHRRFRIPDERHNRPVRARARIDIEQRNALYGFNCIGDLPNDLQIAALRKIRHALNQFSHGSAASWWLLL